MDYTPVQSKVHDSIMYGPVTMSRITAAMAKYTYNKVSQFQH
jgi:hypothetical protein